MSCEVGAAASPVTAVPGVARMSGILIHYTKYSVWRSRVYGGQGWKSTEVIIILCSHCAIRLIRRSFRKTYFTQPPHLSPQAQRGLNVRGNKDNVTPVGCNNYLSDVIRDPALVNPAIIACQDVQDMLLTTGVTPLDSCGHES